MEEYYIYKIEKDSKGNTSERYIGPLDKIVEFYYKKGLVPGLEPSTYGSTVLRYITKTDANCYITTISRTEFR